MNTISTGYQTWLNFPAPPFRNKSLCACPHVTLSPCPGLPIRDIRTPVGDAHQDQARIAVPVLRAQARSRSVIHVSPKNYNQNAEPAAMELSNREIFADDIVHTEMSELPEHGERGIDVGECMLKKVSEIDEQLAQRQLFNNREHGWVRIVQWKLADPSAEQKNTLQDEQATWRTGSLVDWILLRRGGDASNACEGRARSAKMGLACLPAWTPRTMSTHSRRTYIPDAPTLRDPSQRIPPRPRRAAPKVPPAASRKARPAYGDPDPDPDPDRTVRLTDRRRAPVDNAGHVDLRPLADGPHASLAREIAALGAATASEEAATAAASGWEGGGAVVRARDGVGLRPRDADRGTSAVVPEVHPAHLARAQQGPPPSEAHLLHAPNPPRSRQIASVPAHRLEPPLHPQEAPTHPPNEGPSAPPDKGPSLLDDLDGEMSMDLATPLLPAVVVLPMMPHPDALSVAIPHPDAHTYANPAGLSVVIPPSQHTRSPASPENGRSDDDDIDDDTIPTTRAGVGRSAVTGTAGAAGDMMISPLDLTASVSLPEAPAAHSTPNRDPDYYSSSLASNLEYADLRYNPEYAALDGNRDYADLDGNHGYADPHYNNDPSDSSNLEYAGLDGEYHAYAGTGEDAVRELMDMVAVVSAPRSLAPRRFSLHRETGDAAAGNAFDAWLFFFFQEASSAWPEEARVTTRRKLLTPISLR
ncbi:hypothetical protein C8J57DRAFT_1614412 [Mycena rebaudengoi]|nr:hypothetical protein C8J57DRAFT_1614412 [Mycena rebaudengoi]